MKPRLKNCRPLVNLDRSWKVGIRQDAPPNSQRSNPSEIVRHGSDETIPVPVAAGRNSSTVTCRHADGRMMGDSL